jgi:mevalonate kinase
MKQITLNIEQNDKVVITSHSEGIIINIINSNTNPKDSDQLIEQEIYSLFLDILSQSYPSTADKSFDIQSKEKDCLK